MYPDHSLMPKEAIRLAALGMLAEKPLSYAQLASAIRDFTSHVMGPNLDLMGTSIQVIAAEGLIAPVGGGAWRGEAINPDTRLGITDDGRRELESLLLATVRTPFNDINKLVVALKMRFLALLEPARQRDQLALIGAALEGEIARLSALRARRADETDGADPLLDWLDHDIDQLSASLDWFTARAAGI
jgi:DNA-binding PadR family transcriptional regulator